MYPSRLVAVLEEDDPVVHRKFEHNDNVPVYSAAELKRWFSSTVLSPDPEGGSRALAHRNTTTATRLAQGMIQDSMLRRFHLWLESIFL